MLAPDRLLASSGWESPGLLARAAGLRREIVSRRLAGPWWNMGADSGLPSGRSHALILGDGNCDGSNGSTSLELLSVMLAAARAENASRQIVVVAPGHAGRRCLPAGFLRDAAARPERWTFGKRSREPKRSTRPAARPAF